MLIYICSDGFIRSIYNLDNMIKMYAWEKQIRFVGTDGDIYKMINCESEKEAEKVLEKIYAKMTFGSGNTILELEEYRKEFKKEVKEDGNKEE